MSRTTRDTLPGNRRQTIAHLGELRGAVAARLGIDEPTIASLNRVKPANLMMAVGTLVAVGALLEQLSDPAQMVDIVRQSDSRWLLIAVLASLATTVPFTIAFVGSVTRRVALVPSFELQVATCYANLALPGVGGVAAQVRFLQREGVDTAAAVAAGGLLSGLGSVVAQLGICALPVACS